MPEILQVSATTFSVAENQHSDLVRNLTGSQNSKSCQSAWWSRDINISAGVSPLERFCCWEEDKDIQTKLVFLTQSWSLLTEGLPRQTLVSHMQQCKYIETTCTYIVTRIDLTSFRYACGVEIGDKYIVTGGMNVSNWYYGINTVAEYSQSGFVKYLTPMNTPRRSHACSKFVTEDGDTVSQSFW